MGILNLRDGKRGNTEAIIKKNMNLNSYNCLSTGSQHFNLKLTNKSQFYIALKIIFV